MLEAVDALLITVVTVAVTGAGNRPLKSLSDMLKGKQGRFRQICSVSASITQAVPLLFLAHLLS